MVGRKENNQLVPETTGVQVDLALNKNSNNPVANSATSACLFDGIGGTDEKFRFGTDGQGNYGYIKKVDGADTFVPFSSIKNDFVPLRSGNFDNNVTVTVSPGTYTKGVNYIELTRTSSVQPHIYLSFEKGLLRNAKKIRLVGQAVGRASGGYGYGGPAISVGSTVVLCSDLSVTTAINTKEVDVRTVDLSNVDAIDMYIYNDNAVCRFYSIEILY